MQNFLFEIGTEELPARFLKLMAESLQRQILHGLNKAELTAEDLSYFATPRRIAVRITGLVEQQPDRIIERKGPALNAAYNEHGQPTPALAGFARSCGTTIDQLTTLETPQGSWYVYRVTKPGQSIYELLPQIIATALDNLPIPKPMRWNNYNIEFIRPVHWVLMLYGAKHVPANILGLASGRVTYGHRFHHPQAIDVAHESEYETLLNKAHVITDFYQRQQLILRQVAELAQSVHGNAITTSTLLDEVTGLVEWPVALLVPFDEKFLTVPQEALIAAMEDHQKCFPIADQNNRLMPHFITICNIESKDRQEVIQGNERVMRARLADAKFFYETDCKRKLSDRLIELEHVVFQAKLGNLFEKSQRIAALTRQIVESALIDQGERAGLLCKADLTTSMVNEFPELQGIMGGYYAQRDGETNEVANAIREHYLPRHAGDQLPTAPISCAVAIADRVDTLIGIFGIHQAPTGEKDPFSLRRAAIAVLRILIEKQLNQNLYQLLCASYKNYQHELPNKDVIAQVHEFILDRLQNWYHEKSIGSDVLAAVLAVERNTPLDIDKRVHAVQVFRKLPEAQALAAANKRVSNLLKQTQLDNEQINTDPLRKINISLFTSHVEQELYDAIALKYMQQEREISNYVDRLTDLASLRAPIDSFFDAVLVMDKEETLRNNRLALLAALRKLFLEVADISMLQLSEQSSSQ